MIFLFIIKHTYVPGPWLRATILPSTGTLCQRMDLFLGEWMSFQCHVSKQELTLCFIDLCMCFIIPSLVCSLAQSHPITLLTWTCVRRSSLNTLTSLWTDWWVAMCLLWSRPLFIDAIGPLHGEFSLFTLMFIIYFKSRTSCFVTDEDLCGRNVLHVNYCLAMCSLEN